MAHLSTKKNRILIAFAAILIAAAVWLALLYTGVVHINHPDPNRYPIKGVDISSYQGTVDWDVLASQDIRFAFIKATEGSSWIDPYFAENWTNATQTGLRIGAYHFFSFESPGQTQAALFCDTVTRVDDMLPPVVDVEYYGNFGEHNIDVPTAKDELRILVDALTAEYGMKPIIYASKETYETILGNDFRDCDLWFRSVYSAVPSDVEWAFWQYSNRHRLKGYLGKERFIDMNVFYGDADSFAAYPNGGNATAGR